MITVMRKFDFLNLGGRTVKCVVLNMNRKKVLSKKPPFKNETKRIFQRILADDLKETKNLMIALSD